MAVFRSDGVFQRGFLRPGPSRVFGASPAPIELRSSGIGVVPFVLPSHLARDLVIGGRGRAATGLDTINAPWANAFTPLQDGDGTPCTFHVVSGIAAADNGLTYPFTLTGPRHFYWRFRNAVLGAQIAITSGQTGTVVTIPGLTGVKPTSWVVCGFYSRGGQTDVNTRLMTPAGYTERGLQAANTANSLILCDSNGPVGGTTFAGVSAQTLAETGGWLGFAIEIARG